MQPVRGTHDLLPDAYARHRHLKNAARLLAMRYGYHEIQTPLLEFKEVFKRSVGDTSDIVMKEMYEIIDRGGHGEEVVLRPEGTAPIVRAVISNGLTQNLPLKFFYTGPMFRYDRPQKGRLREFHQVGIELLGIQPPFGDVEVIEMAYDLFKLLGVEHKIKLELNTLGDTESRQIYKERLTAYLMRYKHDLSEDSQIRLERNPLRILDSKDERDQRLLDEAPKLADALTSEASILFEDICTKLSQRDIPYHINPRLVRGLDYYCHVAFEFTTDTLGSQATVLAGGRYDKLMETMGGPSMPGIGWAAGVERLDLLCESTVPPSRPITVLAVDPTLEMEAYNSTQLLRKQGLSSDYIYPGGNVGKKLKKANRLNSRLCVLIGPEEWQHKTVTLRDLDQGTQETVSLDNLYEVICAIECDKHR